MCVSPCRCKVLNVALYPQRRNSWRDVQITAHAPAVLCCTLLTVKEHAPGCMYHRAGTNFRMLHSTHGAGTRGGMCVSPRLHQFLCVSQCSRSASTLWHACASLLSQSWTKQARPPPVDKRKAYICTILNKIICLMKHIYICMCELLIYS